MKPIKTDANGNAIVPPLRPGNGLLGPEYYGCCGTGRRPRIVRLRGRYVVGTDLAVDTMLRKIIGTPNKRIFCDGRDTVFAFKTRSPAVAKFHELCAEVRDFNQRTRAEHERAREAARKGDIAGALSLIDF